jgi:hypothetical protein
VCAGTEDIPEISMAQAKKEKAEAEIRKQSKINQY